MNNNTKSQEAHEIQKTLLKFVIISQTQKPKSPNWNLFSFMIQVKQVRDKSKFHSQYEYRLSNVNHLSNKIKGLRHLCKFCQKVFQYRKYLIILIQYIYLIFKNSIILGMF
ncbi:hypothetical protein pb186bvf_019515 [Paramecium bursaria]